MGLSLNQVLQHWVDDGTMKLGCLIAPTAADIRDVMVEGASGLIQVAPPWSRPRFELIKFESTRRRPLDRRSARLPTRNTSGCLAHESWLAGGSTWCWTGSIPSSGSWTPGDCLSILHALI
jgi:hypothetical protein